MKEKILNGDWKLQIIGKDSGILPKGSIQALVPGSVYGALLKENLIPDPFYRDNELKVLPIMENDFEYSRRFEVNEDLLASDEILLVFEGMDTLADVYLNENFVGCTYNMHRIWEFEVSEFLEVGENEIKIILHSPVKYIKEENEKVYAGGVHESMEGFPHLRKAHCMFGWDWGPRLPDAGIFRTVSLKGIEKGRLESVYVTQKHEENRVILDFDVMIELFGKVAEGSETEGQSEVQITVTSPDGTVYKSQADGESDDYHIVIENPQLWWPRGYGKQPLYEVKVELYFTDGKCVDVWQKKIGLRTMTVNTQADEWGNCFAHEVNGVKVFAMGADYIPEDNLLERISEERTRKLLLDAVWANHNCIRIWGGGYYPDDFFFDICDELGLIVWHDFMFACASYELDDAFERNVRREIIDNVRRIRHHACLGLWCGNNEMEDQTLTKVWNPSIKQKYDYIKLFEYIIPDVLKTEDPVTFYWPSSPSSGGNFDNPCDENRGDAHYWDVWHGNKPFTEYRKFHFRYLSEFGFQSFPGLKTIESFTKPEDRNVFSRIMEMHQRNCAANGKIMNYMSATYLYPKDFEHLLYASQLLQADAIRYGVEHFRRDRGRCMGTVVWQLNDIWPVASWSSIDYYGRWKALHYAERKMFAPVMISCEEKGEVSERPFCVLEPAPIEKSARLHVANETMKQVEGIAEWELRMPDSTIILEGREEVVIPALSGVWLPVLDLDAYDERKMHLSYRMLVEGEVVSANSCLFTPPKHYYFENPKLTWQKEGNKLIISAKAYAKNVEIIGVDGDCKFSDNYFDMEAGEYEIEILEGVATIFTCKSVYDIAI